MRAITRRPANIRFHALVLKLWQIQKGRGAQAVSRMEATMSFHGYLLAGLFGLVCLFLIFLLHSLT